MTPQNRGSTRKKRSKKNDNSTTKRRKAFFRIAFTGFFVLGGIATLSALKSFSWDQFYESMLQFDSSWVYAAFIVSMAQVMFQLLRFWIVFTPKSRPNSWDLHSANLIGQTLNSFAPLRSGDAFKLIRLNSAGTPLHQLGTALVAERIADTLALFLLSGYAAFAFAKDFVSGLAGQTIFMVVLAIIGGIFLFSLTIRYRDIFPISFRPFFNDLIRFLSSTRDLVVSRRFIYCLVISGVTWALDAGTLWCSARAGGILISPETAMVSIFGLNMGIAVPLTIANAGVFEASLGFALKASVPGLSLEKALNIATLEHSAKIVGLLGCLALGVIFYFIRKTHQSRRKP